MSTNETENSGFSFKKLAMEIGFFLGVIVAVVLTAIDIVLGLFRYAWGRVVQRRPNFNPWENVCNIWRLIGRHIAYLFKVVLVPSFRATVAENRAAMHRQVNNIRLQVGGAKAALSDFDYVDVETALVFMWALFYGVFVSIITINALVATVTVVSLIGVYHMYELPKPAAAPQPDAKVVFQPQVADQQETDFGPWNDRGTVIAKVNDPGFRNIAMLSDTGSVKYSAEKTADASVFTPLAFTERVVNPHPNDSGQMVFDSQTGKRFVVNKGQAFLFEGYNPKVFLFLPDGRLAAVDSSKMKTK